MKCPKCGHVIRRNKLAGGLGKLTSEAKAKSSRENGKKGGRPRTNDSSSGTPEQRPVRRPEGFSGSG